MTDTSIKDILHREIEVAFSRHAQPVWFRITKWIVIMTGIFFFRTSEYLMSFILILTAAGILLHLIWRYKTKGWTRSWLGWDAEINRPKNRTINEQQL